MPLLYEAVSYAWGEDAETECIFDTSAEHVQDLPVRKNVVEMLRYLRRRFTPRVLWIDAICIDQTNHTEREKQVCIMGDIYSSAAQVLIWVGPPDPEQSVSTLLNTFNGENYEAARFVAYRDFIPRKWFQRRWVIQEVINARVAIMVCDNEAREFCTWAENIAGNLNAWSMKAVSFKLTAINEELLKHLSDLGALHKTDGTGGVQKPSMANQLVRFHAANCSDDRDRFYALNSLSDDPIPVSYQQSIGDVCYQYACSEIVRFPSRLLSCAAAFPGDIESSASWIPDLTRTLKHKPLYSSFDPSADPTRPDGLVKINGMSITAMARPMDRVRIAWKPDLSQDVRVQVSEMDDNASKLLNYNAFFASHCDVNIQDLIHGFDPFLIKVLTNNSFWPLFEDAKSAEKYRDFEFANFI